MLTAHLTENWSQERLFAYGPQITAAMSKLRDRFPHDVSVPDLVDEIFKGSKQLWLVLDGDEFVSFALTEIKTLVTGYKVVVVTDLAGEGGTGNCPLVADIEAWALEQGADEVRLFGRVGWRKALAKEGYAADFMTYAKPLARAEIGVAA